MAEETICKTVHQYNKFPISDEDMKKLQEIAEDYRTVKMKCSSDMVAKTVCQKFIRATPYKRNGKKRTS